MATAPELSETSKRGPTPSVPTPSSPTDHRIWWILGGAIVVLVFVHVVALRQAPDPNVYSQPTRLSMDWWTHPIEWNAPQRLPQGSADLYDVAVVPGTGAVWAVGDAGMVLRSSDGASWSQDTTAQRVLTTLADAPSEDCRSYDPSTVESFVDRGGQIVLRSDEVELFWAEVNASPDAVVALARAHREVCFLGRGSGGSPVLSPSLVVYWQDRTASASTLPGPCVSYDPRGLQIEQRSDGAWELVATDGGTNRVLRTVDRRSVAERLLILARRQSVYCPLGGTVASPKQQTAPRTSLSKQQSSRRSGSESSSNLRPQNARRVDRLQERPNSGMPPVLLISSPQSVPSSPSQSMPELPVVIDSWVWPSGAPDLRTIRFTEDGRGWIAGPGAVLQTTDRGATWTHAVETPPAIDSIGGAATADSLAPRLAETTGDTLRSVAFANEQEGWTAGTNGTLLHTTDAGTTWVPALRPQRTIRALRRVTSTWRMLQTGPAGRPAELWRSSDGQTWSRAHVFDTSAVVDVQFAGDTTGYALTNDGRVLVNEDDSPSWAELSALQPDERARGIRFTAMDRSGSSPLWLAGRRNGETLVARWGEGASWQEAAPDRLAGIEPTHLAVSDAEAGWLAGTQSDGTPVLFRTSDGGQTWRRTRQFPEEERILDLAASDPKTLWAVGPEGALQVSHDAGNSWEEPATLPPEAPDLRALHFTNEQVGMAAGTNGAVWRTVDGGTTWTTHDLFPYARWPAPWYYVVVFLLVGGTVSVLLRIHRQTRPVEEKESVADRLMSDRPLRRGDPDALDLGRIARGLSRFMRNAKTEPPLTVAVTGAWGSGKSSLMNLLQDDLRGFGFRPVWFNAWHHQKEEHLLAALLENVRSQALPPVWTRAGAAFRLRLLWLRTRRHVPIVLGVLFAFLGAVGLLAHSLAEEGGRVNRLWEVLPADATWTALAETLGTLGIAAGSAVSLLVLLGRGLTAFGVTPAVLMASLRSNARVRDLRDQTGFRYRFQQAFREVTEALHPRTMVIFIDDLDRCRPSNVLEVLEAVNFLVDSGSCYVVLGLDLDRVQHYVEIGFRDVDEEGFAAHYLEKLINIEVPVPQATGDQLLEVVLPDGTTESEAEEARRQEAAEDHERRVRQVRGSLHSARNLIVAVALAAVAVWSVQGVAEVFTTPPSEQQVQSEAGVQEGGGDEPDEETPGSTLTSETNEEGPSPSLISAQDLDREVARLTQGAEAPAFWDLGMVGWMGLPLLGLLAVGAWILVQPTGLVVHDSPEFEEAIEIWHPVLVEHVETPRGIKRFMNRVRYYAMHLRPPDPPSTVARRIAGWLSPPPEPPDRGQLREEMLVAICVLYTANRLQALVSEDPSGDGAPILESGELGATVTAALKAHTERFGSVRPTAMEWRHRLDEVLLDADLWDA